MSGKVKHGMHLSSEYNSWAMMKSRCANPNNPVFSYYGGRGIQVCDRWLESFEAFLADMGRKPNRSFSIDRIDVNGNYEPSNCRWADKREQAQNTRANRDVTVDGVTMCVTEWARITGISISTIYVRTGRGWSWEEAVSIPPDPKYFNKKTQERKKANG